MRVVVLGTGTEIGKTFVTTHLAKELGEAHDVLALKPIETGWPGSADIDGDLRVAPANDSDAATIAFHVKHPPYVPRYALSPPVSPHLAARNAGIEIDVAAIADWVRRAELDSNAEVTLVETAGAAFSPLSSSQTNVDLALALEPARWVLVAPDSLGVLHDVTATLRGLGDRSPEWVVLSQAREPDSSTGTNARELETLGITPVTTTVRRSAPEDLAGLAAKIRRALAS